MAKAIVLGAAKDTPNQDNSIQLDSKIKSFKYEYATLPVITLEEEGKVLMALNNSAVWSDLPQIPIADNNRAGISKVGSNLTIDENSILNVPIATTESFGVVKIGSGLNISNEGLLTTREVNVATNDSAGIVKPSIDLKVDTDGVLSINSLWPFIMTITALSHNSFIVEDTINNRKRLTVGMPIRLTNSSNEHSYHIIREYIKGKILITGSISTEETYDFCIGSASMISNLNIDITGAFADKETNSLIKDKTNKPLYWNLPNATLVSVYATIDVEDSTARLKSPSINILANSSLTAKSNLFSLKQIETSTDRVITHGSLDVYYNDEIEIKVTKATGGTPSNDAENLSVTLMFILH